MKSGGWGGEEVIFARSALTLLNDFSSGRVFRTRFFRPSRTAFYFNFKRWTRRYAARREHTFYSHGQLHSLSTRRKGQATVDHNDFNNHHFRTPLESKLEQICVYYTFASVPSTPRTCSSQSHVRLM